jgi:hypothetical protein
VPVTKNDNGVDGYGINIFGKTCAIQPKYRSNTKKLLTGNDSIYECFAKACTLVQSVICNKYYCIF